MFWHVIWKQCGCPAHGVVANIRRTSRAKYHQAIRHTRKQNDMAKANKLATSMLNKRSRDFWTEVAKIRGSNHKLPGSVDGIQSEPNISEHFARKYEHLYNSVSYNKTDMSILLDDINKAISHQCCKSASNPSEHLCENNHNISVNDFRAALSHIKYGKSDGCTQCSSDHIKHGTPKLHVYFSLVLSKVLSHGYVPKDMLMGTISPIPKNRKKSLNDSDNYRSIALSSILGKILDWIILDRHKGVFQTVDAQFGFKPKHSTSQCTFVVNETIQYYINGGSNVYTMMLDASKAFDRVQYFKLFNLLIKKGLCPLTCRLIAIIYTNQLACVRWGQTKSKVFSVTNGVKQGGVMSPILFNIYVNELFVNLEKSKAGCYIGQKFMGAFGYADDIILLAPSKHALSMLLDITHKYSKDYNVMFNPEKSKLLIFGDNQATNISIVFDGKLISPVKNESHLGNILGVNIMIESVKKITHDFTRRVNGILGNFKFCYFPTKYQLFKVFCMSLYGSVLWDFSSKHVGTFFTTWRKCLRRLLGIPYRTHNALLYLICNDDPVEWQLHSRFLKFIQSCLRSENKCLQLCATLSMHGSGSNMCKSINYICNQYNILKWSLANASLIKCNSHHVAEDLLSSAGIIRDLLHIRDNNHTSFTHAEIEFMLNFLCVH